MKLNYDVDRLMSILLNHRYPDHNVRKMLPFSRLDVQKKGDDFLFTVIVPDEVIKATAPGSGKDFPWS